MAHSSVGRAFLAVFALGFLVMGACTEDTIISESRDPFNPPPDSANGFLGYYDAEAKQTTCGNCHADQAADWEGTGHSDAWAGLQLAGDNVEASCEGCHAVSENGNSLTDPAGINVLDPDDAAGRAAYFDVQCENCHGPGADHAANPQATKPLASIEADVDLGNGCGDCHTGIHAPFVEQWSQSNHGAVPAWSISSFSRIGAECIPCHTGQGALETTFLENANYVEKGGDKVPIVCAVCHDPHTHDFDAQLRAPLDEGSRSQLCIKCHNNRTVPTATTHGPHAAQGPLVLAENIGWWPDSLDWRDGLVPAHGDVDVNPRLCGTCHVESFEVTDAATGDFVFQSVGHLFEAIPCLDANGIPVPGGNCTTDQRTFTACVRCHMTEDIARSAYELFKAELTGYLKKVWNDANGNDILDTGDTGLLVSIVAQEGGRVLDASDELFTVAEGILWNAQLARTDDAPWFGDFHIEVTTGNFLEIGGHPASGNGVHNPKFLRALMIASINHGAAHYGVPNPLPVELRVLPEGVVRK